MAQGKISKLLTFLGLILLFILALSLVFYPKMPNINKEKPVIVEIIKNPKVFSDIKARFIDVRRIRITIPDGAFQLIKTGENWQLQERENYPVSMEFLKIFADDIANLEKGGLVTNDPTLFDKMGVGEPMEFGEGTIIELFDPQDQVISSSHIGKINNEIYVRRMGDRNIFSATGKFTDIGIISNWLDLNIININKEEVSNILINRIGAPNIDILYKGDFFIDEIHNSKISDLSTLLLKPKFIDVLPQNRIKNNAIAKINIVLKNGQIIEYEIFQQYKAYWVKFSANNFEAHQLISKTFAKDWAYKIEDNFAKEILQSKSGLKAFIK